MTNTNSIPLIEREIFFGNPKITGGQLSPDGRFITFIKAYKDVLNIWIKPIDSDFDEAVPLTSDANRPIRSYFWSRDSRFIIYAQDKGGDENFALYRVDPNESGQESVPEAIPLTPVDNVTSYVVSLPKNKPDTIIVAINDRDPAWHDYYEINIDSGSRKLLMENSFKYNSVYADLEGRLRMAGRSLNDGGNEILSLDGDKPEVIFKATLEESIAPLKFRPDGKVYFLSNTGDTDLVGLYLYDPNTGAMTLVEEDPRNEVDIETASFSRKTQQLIATVYYGDKKKIYWKDKSYEADYNFLCSEFEGHEISVTSSTEDEDKWIFVVSSDTDPGKAYLYDRAKRKYDFLYCPRPELPVKHLAHMTPVRYPSEDGLEVPAYLTVPRYKPEGHQAAIIFVHGGPWARDYWGYNGYAQFFANRGYAVLQPNFRGSTGFGKSFLNAAINQWGEKMQDDITAGYKYLVDNKIAHPDNVAIIGGSYGGYATLAGLCFTPEIYAAGVSIVGPSNLFTLLETIPPYWESARAMFHKRMGDPTTPEGREQLTRQSPLFHAEQIRAPLLVAQGANDPRVKKSESDQIVIAMRNHGLPVEYINFPDEGHGFAHPDNNMAFVAVMERFLALHLGGRYQKEVSETLGNIIENARVDISQLRMPEPLTDEILKAPMPEVERELSPGTFDYGITLELQGQHMAFDLTRKIEQSGNLVEIEDIAAAAMGTMTEKVNFEVQDFKPVSRFISQGPLEINIRNENNGIRGYISMDENARDVSQDFDAAFLFDGTMLDSYMSALMPTNSDKKMIRVFDTQQQRLEFFRIEHVKASSANEDFLAYNLVDHDTGTVVHSYKVSKGSKAVLLQKRSVVKAMNGAVIEMKLRAHH